MNAKLTANKKQGFDEDKAFPHILMAPTIIVMLLLTVYPLLFTVYYSFTDYNLLKSRTKGVNFIAFDNYVKLLQNPIYHEKYQYYQGDHEGYAFFVTFCSHASTLPFLVK